jgi:hypothetical protein
MVCGNTDHGDDALVCSQMLPSDWYYVIIGNNFIEEFEMDYQIRKNLLSDRKIFCQIEISDSMLNLPKFFFALGHLKLRKTLDILFQYFYFTLKLNITIPVCTSGADSNLFKLAPNTACSHFLQRAKSDSVVPFAPARA